MRKILIRAVIAIAVSYVCSPVVLAEEVKSGDRFSAVGAPRAFASAPGVHECIFTAGRGPSPFDRIALHRITRSTTESSKQAVVLYLPGTWMNGTVAPDDTDHSLALFLAAHDVDFWALDYRTHFVPAESSQGDRADLKDWTNGLFAADIDAAARFIMARTGEQRIVVAGFSRGVSFAYLFAVEHPQNVAGLLLFDGYIGHGETGSPPAGIYAEDVAGKHLTWDKRAALLKLVIDNPHAPAPIAKYKDAADNLDHVVYDSAGFGGKGGLANPIGGFYDPAILARVLITYDRYWPIVQNYEDSFPPAVMAGLRRSRIPVFAFSSTNIAPDWPDRVVKSAASTGSNDMHVTRLQGWGHLDVICGTHAVRDVFTPALEWLRRLRE
jgi:pimeloyl-ACP methyl ester carboxylesterase